MYWLDIPRVDEPEMIDSPDQPIADLAESMGDVARTNTLFGGTSAVVGSVASLLKTVPKDRPIRILDVGTGSGDIPRALVRWGRTNGRSIDVVAVDNLWSMLSIAKSQDSATQLVRTINEFACSPRLKSWARKCGPSAFADGVAQGASSEPLSKYSAFRLEEPEDAKRHIEFVQADALALPFAAGAFDIATCALTFHHLGFGNSARVLAQMERLTTRGFVVTDLRRDRVSLALVSAGLALIRAHPFTRHDGPASIRRAFTPREYEKIVALSGVRNVRITSSWYSRIILVKEKTGGCTSK